MFDKLRNKLHNYRTKKKQLQALSILDSVSDLEYLSGDQKTKLRENLFALGLGTGIDKDEHEYVNLSTFGRRDLTPHTFDEIMLQAANDVETNGLLARAVDLPIQAMKQAGVSFSAEDETTQQFLDDFWRDNESLFWKLSHDFIQNGEWHTPPQISESGGILDLAFIDPLNVKSVKTLKGNALIKDKLVMKADKNGKEIELDIIKKRFGFFEGEVFSFFYNAPVNSTRGRSYLKTAHDFAQQYDDIVFSEAERISILKAFVFHANSDNWGPGGMDEFREKYFPQGIPPNPGSLITSSGDFTFEAVTPNINASDMKEALKFLRNNILGALGQLGALHGFGEDINVATLRESLRSVIWLINDFQSNLKAVLRMIIEYALVKAVEFAQHNKAGTFTQSTNLEFDIDFNNVFPKDLANNSAVWSQATTSLSVAITNDIIDLDEARREYAWIMNQIDYEVKAEDLFDEDAADDEGDSGFGFDEPPAINGDLPEKQTISQLLNASYQNKMDRLKKI